MVIYSQRVQILFINVQRSGSGTGKCCTIVRRGRNTFLGVFFLLLIVSLIHESCGVFRLFFFVLENIFERLIQLNCPLLRESVKVKPPVHINILSEISREVTRLVKF